MNAVLISKKAGILTDNSDGLAKSRRGVLSYNYISGIITSLMTGTYFTGLMLSMGADADYISAVTIAITVTGFAQFFSPLILERIKKRRAYLMLMRAVYHLFNVVLLGIIPLLPLAKQASLALFIVTVIVANLINSLSASGMAVWHIQNVPKERHSDFFTLSNVGMSVLNAATAFLAARVVDSFNNSGVTLLGIGSPLIAFLAIRAFALLLAIAEMIVLRCINEHPYDENSIKKVHLTSLFVPLKNRTFMKIILIYIIYFFVSALIGRYFQTYLVDVVKMSYTYQSLSSVIGLPIVLMISPLWSRLLRRHSWTRVLPIAIFGTAVGYFFNTLITVSTQYFHIACCVIYSTFHVAVAIIFAYLPYVAMPKTDRTAYVSFFTISGSVAGLLGNLVGAGFMKLMQGVEFSLFSLPVTSYQLLNLLQTVLFALLSLYSVFAVRSIQASEKTQNAQE